MACPPVSETGSPLTVEHDGSDRDVVGRICGYVDRRRRGEVLDDFVAKINKGNRCFVVRSGRQRERAVGESAAVVGDAERNGVIARVGGCRAPEQEAAAAVNEHAAGTGDEAKRERIVGVRGRDLIAINRAGSRLGKRRAGELRREVGRADLDEERLQGRGAGRIDGSQAKDVEALLEAVGDPGDAAIKRIEGNAAGELIQNECERLQLPGHGPRAHRSARRLAWRSAAASNRTRAADSASAPQHR